MDIKTANNFGSEFIDNLQELAEKHGMTTPEALLMGYDAMLFLLLSHRNKGVTPAQIAEMLKEKIDIGLKSMEEVERLLPRLDGEDDEPSPYKH